MEEVGIRIVRLTSGEEVLCKLYEDESNYKLNKPHVLLPMAEGRLAIAPFCPYADIGTTGMEIEKKFIMFVVKPGKDMQDQYTEMTTGLVTAPAGIDTSKLKLTT